MPRKSTWWVEMEFNEFCSHYLFKSDAEIVSDVKESIMAMIDRKDEGECFGAKMVRKANEISARKSETNRRNVNARWHPEEIIQQRPTEKAKSQRVAKFPSVNEIYDFAAKNGMDMADARDFYEMTFVERDGKDRSGKNVKNWQGMLTRFCESRAKKRAV